MNCLTIRTPDIGYICKCDLKIDQSQGRTLWQVRQIKQISPICLLELNFGKPQLAVQQVHVFLHMTYFSLKVTVSDTGAFPTRLVSPPPPAYGKSWIHHCIFMSAPCFEHSSSDILPSNPFK